MRWAELLKLWTIPGELIEAAAESPYFFDPRVFIDAADTATARDIDTPSDRAARDALPAGGSVLDVGVGAGAASLRLGAARVTGVDPSRALLDAFTERATSMGVQPIAVEGAWPAVSAGTPTADVAVCHHVAYNVADLAAFAQALTGHARRRVVLELTAVHPMTWLTPYWKALYNRSQPDRPTADDAIAVLAELRLAVNLERWRRPIQMLGETGDEQLARVARRLCLPAQRHRELAEVLAATPPPVERDVATIWWETHGA